MILNYRKNPKGPAVRVSSSEVRVTSPIQARVIALDLRSDYHRYICSSSRTNLNMHHSLVSVVRTTTSYTLRRPLSSTYQFHLSREYRVTRSYSTRSRETIIKEFWDQIYIDIEANTIYSQEGESRSQTQVSQLLDEYQKVWKSRPNIGGGPLEWEWKELESRIEDITLKFDEKSILTSTPNLIKLLIGKDPLSAKVYLSRHISPDTYICFLMPRILASLNLKKAFDLILLIIYFKSTDLASRSCSFYRYVGYGSSSEIQEVVRRKKGAKNIAIPRLIWIVRRTEKERCKEYCDFEFTN